jgi:hypothetical protein
MRRFPSLRLDKIILGSVLLAGILLSYGSAHAFAGHHDHQKESTDHGRDHAPDDCVTCEMVKSAPPEEAVQPDIIVAVEAVDEYSGPPPIRIASLNEDSRDPIRGPPRLLSFFF